MEENKNMFVIVQVIIAMIMKTFIKVKDMVIFLNGVYGTTTITEEKVNQMLIDSGYQVSEYDFETSDDVLLDDYSSPTTYIPTKKANDFYEVQLVRNDEPYLIWRADILIEIFRITPLKNINILTSLFLANSIIHHLVDEDEEMVNIETLKSNVQVLQEILKSGGNYARKQ